jgi:hypothetical protein
MLIFKRTILTYLALVIIASSSCTPKKVKNTEYGDVANFKYAFGSYTGRLTLFGDSIWSKGDYIFIVQNLDQNDTLVGSYIINAQENDLVGTAISGYDGVLFSLYPSLDSGYLFDECQFKLFIVRP